MNVAINQVLRRPDDDKSSKFIDFLAIFRVKTLYLEAQEKQGIICRDMEDKPENCQFSYDHL